jgi:two-component system NarL family sensor kinase
LRSKILFVFLICFRLLSAQDDQALIQRMESHLPDLKETFMAVDTLNELAWVLSGIGDWNKAKGYATQALSISQKLNYLQGSSDSYMRLGLISEGYWLQSMGEGSREMAETHFLNSLEYYKKALGLRARLGNFVGAAKVHNNLGTLYADQGDFQNAAFEYQAGLSCLDTIPESSPGYWKTKARILNNLSDALLHLGDYKQAIQRIEKSIAIRKENELYYSLAHSYLNAGAIYLENKIRDLPKAKRYFHESLNLYKQYGDQGGIAKCYNNLGNLYLFQEKFDSALVYFDRALEEDLLDPLDVFKVLRNKGSIFSRQGNPEKALEFFNEGLKRISTIGNKEEIARLYLDMGTVLVQKKRYDEAVDYLSKSRKIADSSQLFGLELLSTAGLASSHKQEVFQERTRRNIQLLVALVILLSILGIAFFMISINRRKRQIAEQNARLARQEVDGLLQKQELQTAYARLAGQEEERKRVAQDLHDRLGVMLSTAKLYFQPLQASLKKVSEESIEPLQNVKQILDDAVKEVRRISHNMFSPTLTSLGLASEVRILADRIREAKSVDIQLTTSGMEERLKGMLEVQLYRVIQEAVGNALKYAEASSIHIQITQSEEFVKITIQDDGKGFDSKSIMGKGKGMGLSNMSARVQELNGQIKIDSEVGKGTQVAVEVPLERAIY